MPKKKTGPNKSDFVRSQPAELSASDVVAKAKEAGLTITPGLVYAVRAYQKSKGAKTKKTTTTAAASAKAPKAEGSKPSASDFIRSLPSSVTATAVAKQGAAEGYSFKTGLVYKVRRAMKKHQPKAAKAAHAAHEPKAAAPHAHASHASHASHRNEFRRLMIQIGLDQAEALYADVHGELKAIASRD